MSVYSAHIGGKGDGIIQKNTIEIFQSKKKKKMSVAEFYIDENGREVVRW